MHNAFQNYFTQLNTSMQYIPYLGSVCKVSPAPTFIRRRSTIGVAREANGRDRPFDFLLFAYDIG